MNTFCTVVTPSYLSFASALAKSLSQSGNQEILYVLLVDDGKNPIELHNLPNNLKICTLSNLTRELPSNICFYYNSFELCNTLKPFIVEYLLNQGFEKVIFLDSDIYVVGSFDPVWIELDRTSLLLTTHHLLPPDLSITYATESSVADMGIFNGGFAGWRATDVTVKMLDWMCTRFPVYGFCDRQKGMFVDQKLLPLLLQYFHNDIDISRDNCLNIAFWNCHERNVKSQDGTYLIEDKSVIFFHMSGFRLSKPSLPCSYLPKHENLAILASAPWLSLILEEYKCLLQSCTLNFDQLTSPFSEFNGIKLTPDLRRVLFRKGHLKYLDREVATAMASNVLRSIKQYLFPYRSQ